MSQARIQDVAAIAEFKHALREFDQDARAALCAIDLEIGRALDWLTIDRARYWQSEVRRRSDAVVQAKAELHRCRSIPMPGGGTPSCQDQKRELERTQARLREAEEKVGAVRHWARVVEHEVGEYQGRANQLAVLLDADLPRAVAALEHAQKTLDSYLAAGPSAYARPLVPGPTTPATPGKEQA